MAAVKEALAAAVPAPLVRGTAWVQERCTRYGNYPADAALAFIVLCTMLALLRIDDEGTVHSEVEWYGYVLVVIGSVPLVWRRRWPFGTGVTVALAAIVYDRMPGLPSQHLQYGALVGVYTVADRGPDSVRRWIPLLSLIGLLAAGVSVQDLLYGNMFPMLSLLTAYVLGCSARTRRAYAAALEARAEQLARERDLEADRAASRERERIAREMHDILGHAVSLMVVQAEAGPVVVRSDPARAEAAFEAIADAGRDAMAQLRRMLGLLNRPGQDDDGAAGEERAPQAGVDTLPELLARVRETGLQITLEATGTPVPLAADRSLAVYRLVQESLTNTVRHAGASRAEVRLAWGPDALDVEVRDDGIGAQKTASADSGFGLVGLAQRIEAVGGTLTAGPAAGGPGFRVATRLPLPLPAAPAEPVPVPPAGPVSPPWSIAGIAGPGGLCTPPVGEVPSPPLPADRAGAPGDSAAPVPDEVLGTRN
ncbi:sensor histidine kinase [Yinghuangia soli]|uniref:histidine kinase n=1 Tax=Yinghuangia soli TaxID=2908204 RepID=A0AA41Q0V1_9ACTN|nr:histidine kinase [Yinghuangia soli]MCF2529147.1 histidine kinase [Yinghuangia soli]